MLSSHDLVSSSYSFAIACFGAATVFLFLQRQQVASQYRTAVTISGIVTLIACYHYSRIAYDYSLGRSVDLYRYVDWLLTVPLLLIEFILALRLSENETRWKSFLLSVLALSMIVFGYFGEIAPASSSDALKFFILSCIPFLAIIYQLFFGLSKAISAQPASSKSLIANARNLIAITWLFYPIVYALRFKGFDPGSPSIQLGYTLADIIAKAGLGIMIYSVSMRKTSSGN
jgi:bacteriorhodopsin